MKNLSCTLVFLILFFTVGGCATYTDQISEAHRAVDRGDYALGIGKLNAVLGVKRSEDVPDKWKGQRPLAVLERGMLHQATGNFKLSKQDLSAGEAELEWLDLKGDSIGKIGKYIYSDSATVYKASPTERLALNAFNLLNYLSLEDLGGATVEARRFTVGREYLDSLESQKGKTHGAFGSYMAGFVFEQQGEADRALRYYEEALDDRDLAIFREPLVRLSRRGNYQGAKLKGYLEKVEVGPKSQGENDGLCEVLVVVGVGRVPYKEPRRIPIGAAIGLAGAYLTGDAEILKYSVFKVLTYPELVERRNAKKLPGLTFDGKAVSTELLTDLGDEIRREYKEIRAQIIASALTRMIARAAVTEGVRAAAKEKGDTTALLAALGTELLLVTMDKPDTRSWTMLPDRIYMSRLRVTPGKHELQVDLPGSGAPVYAVKIDVAADEFSVIGVMDPR
ncbi:MAG: hypothetical protein K9M57_03470 [Phycisphaerae bacterium]|nr:hypothetical protein [Phycisphaerae bacterium]